MKLDRKKQNVISKMARDLAFTEDDVRLLSLDLFGKSYDSLSNDDAKEMINYLRLQDQGDFWGLENGRY